VTTNIIFCAHFKCNALNISRGEMFRGEKKARFYTEKTDKFVSSKAFRFGDS